MRIARRLSENPEAFVLGAGTLPRHPRIARSSKLPRVAIDTETTGLNAWTGARPFAVSACWEDGRTAYWEWEVDPKRRAPIIPRVDLLEVRALVADAGTRKYFFNARFDAIMLESIGAPVRIATVEEVSFAARAVNNLEFAYKLKPLAKKYAEVPDDDEKHLHDMVVRARRLAKRLGVPVGEEVENDYWLPRTLFLSHPQEAREAGLDPNACKKYAVRDAERTMILGALYDVAMDDLGVRDTYEQEMELMPDTVEMERHGVRVDEKRLGECRKVCERELEKYTQVLRDASMRPDFNPSSPQQVVKLLFGPGSVAKLPALKRTKKGQPKTDAEALAPHKKHPLVEALFRVRANGQALKLFFNKYAGLATRDPEQGMILHPGFKQWGTLTGRYSCSDPNLQQVSDPDTTNSLAAEYVVDVRQVFVPRKGYVWFCPDYSQIEVVIFADISGEQALIDAIRSGQDIHGTTVERVWGGRDNPRAIVEACKLLKTDDRGLAIAKLDEYDWRIGELEKSLDLKVIRKRSKAVTFTKIFGGGPLALMRWIGVSREEAVQILNAYDDSFPTMVEKMREIELRGKKDGFVVNPFGRRLVVDPWHAYRAVNHLVQSAAADLMKMGMRKCSAYLRELGLDARILMTIHDELIFEVRREHALKHMVSRIKQIMSDHGGVFSVPVKVDVEKVTERWSEKSKVELVA